MRTLLDRPANYDHDFDGRPPVAWHGEDDPLLELLIRCHPEHMPVELVDSLRARPPRRFDLD